MTDWNLNIQNFAVRFVPFIIAVVFHEYAHGLVAKFWGDKTAEEQGRLTLNPIPHIDPIGTVIFPGLNMLLGIPWLIGWARPVPIDPKRFRKFRAGLFWVSLAGPGMNFILANVSALILCGIQSWVIPTFYLFDPLSHMAFQSVLINYMLMIFNLIPLPPLDGSKMIEAFLPHKAARKYETLTQYSFFILMALMFTGAFAYLRYPIELFSRMTLGVASAIFQLPEVL